MAITVIKTDDADNIDCALGYIETLREHLKVLVENTRGTDNMAATRAMELANQIEDVLQNGY